MKSKGIIRRFDDLGRISIPKEFRKLLGIKNGSPVEIYTSKLQGDKKEPCIVLLPYAVEVEGLLESLTDALCDLCQDSDAESKILYHIEGIRSACANNSKSSVIPPDTRG